jgi:hypothetical protein
MLTWYKERLLSPRIVHFTPWEIFFECTEGLNCQCTPSNHGTPSDFKARFSRDEITHEDWRLLVKVYSTKDFTQPGDVLPALDGIANRVRGGGRYMFGMWENWLLQDLAWYSVAGPQWDSESVPPYRTGAISPSFCWSSVVGPTLFLDNISSTSLKTECKMLEINKEHGYVELETQVLPVSFVNIFETPQPATTFIKHTNYEHYCMWATLKCPGLGHFIYHPDVLRFSTSLLRRSDNPLAFRKIISRRVTCICIQLCSDMSEDRQLSYGLVLKNISQEDGKSLYKREGLIATIGKKQFQQGERKKVRIY